MKRQLMITVLALAAMMIGLPTPATAHESSETTLEALNGFSGNDTVWRHARDHAVARVINPADYECGPATPQMDVAVLVLKEPAVGITPATLAPDGFLELLDELGLLRSADEGAPFTVVGYGNYGEPPNELMAANGIRRAAVSEFMHLNDLWMFLDQKTAHGNGGSANGDSGGPTFWIDPTTGKETLVAIVSNGDATAVATA